jgi:hypothetical protein
MVVAVQTSKNLLALVVNQDYFIGIFLQGVIAGLIGLAVYLFVCYLLAVPEFMHFRVSFKKRWLKWRGIEVGEGINL